MNRHHRYSLSHRLLPLVLMAGVTACDSLGGFPGGGGGEGADAASSDDAAPGILRIEEREVERPDVYASDARGLWDGRFSLGGRWVAVEQDIDAERVRITNADNGRVIEGALFPREFDLPGPPIMVSMDAAVALGMQAGTPANLNVVALRTETVEIPAPPPPPGAEAPVEDAADDADAVVVDPDAAPTTGIETAAVATTSLDAAATAPAATSALAQSRIQVAGGSNKSGAEAVVKRLQAVNVPASVSETTANGSSFFRVVAGPFSTKAEFDAALAEIRKLGYSDAFPTK